MFLAPYMQASCIVCQINGDTRCWSWWWRYCYRWWRRTWFGPWSRRYKVHEQNGTVLGQPWCTWHSISICSLHAWLSKREWLKQWKSRSSAIDTIWSCVWCQQLCECSHHGPWWSDSRWVCPTKPFAAGWRWKWSWRRRLPRTIQHGRRWRR